MTFIPPSPIPITPERFDQFIQLPEHHDRIFELIAGEIVEKMPSNTFASWVAMQIARFIFRYLDQHDIGNLTGEQGGYMIGGERYAPDLAFVSYDRQPQPYPDKGYNPNLPSLIVEVISSDTAAEHRNLRIKVSNYLAAGIEVWVVDPAEKLIEVHRQGEPTHLYRPSDLLTSTIFPGFEMVVEAIFAYGTSDDE
jgi:Uma2 family endonuclease